MQSEGAAGKLLNQEGWNDVDVILLQQLLCCIFGLHLLRDEYFTRLVSVNQCLLKLLWADCVGWPAGPIRSSSYYRAMSLAGRACPIKTTTESTSQHTVQLIFWLRFQIHHIQILGYFKLKTFHEVERAMLICIRLVNCCYAPHLYFATTPCQISKIAQPKQRPRKVTARCHISKRENSAQSTKHCSIESVSLWCISFCVVQK